MNTDRQEDKLYLQNIIFSRSLCVCCVCVGGERGGDGGGRERGEGGRVRVGSSRERGGVGVEVGGMRQIECLMLFIYYNVFSSLLI